MRRILTDHSIFCSYPCESTASVESVYKTARNGKKLSYVY